MAIRHLSLTCSLMLCAWGAVFSSWAAERADETALRRWAYDAWSRVMREYYSPKTGGIYACAPEDVQPARDFPGGLLKKELRYGKGLEDCAITGGVALSGLVDAYAVTKDPLFATDAEKVAKGLLNLVNAHPYKGFVARGLCVEDGKSICRLTSRDQVTHWVHGLWRYRRSGMMPVSMNAAVRTAFADVAGLMERNVTEANGWNFLQSDGTMDPRGICKMRKTNPHEAARLAMIYIAAADVTGDGHWMDLYREVRAEALADSLLLPTLTPQKIHATMPTYTMLQMNSSLELIWNLETDPGMRAKAARAMGDCARLARKRFESQNGRNDSICMCGEALLAQMMVPGTVSWWDSLRRAALATEIMRVPVAKANMPRLVHLFAAYWRARTMSERICGAADGFRFISVTGVVPDGRKGVCDTASFVKTVDCVKKVRNETHFILYLCGCGAFPHSKNG